MDPDRVIEVYKNIRIARGFSYEYLADQIGVAKSSLWSWENRKTKVTLENAIKWGEALGIYFRLVFE